MSKNMIRIYFFLLFLIFCAAQRTNYLMTIDDPEFSDMHYSTKYVFWGFCVLFIGITRHVFTAYDVPISHDAFCLICGILWGIGALYDSTMFTLAKPVQSKLIIRSMNFVYLPMLLFSTAFSMDFYVFLKSLPQILVISGPASVTCSVLTGCMMLVITETNWGLERAIIFGFIASCIHPMDVIDSIKEASVQTKYVTCLLHGESLLATTIAIYIIDLMFNYVRQWIAYWYQFVMTFVRIFVLGVPLSYLFGLLGTYLMKVTFNNTCLLMLLMIASCYTSSFVTAWIADAGVLASAVTGIMMGTERGSLARETRESLENFWKVICSTLNGIIFIMIGIRAPSILYNVPFKDYILVFVTYLTYNVSRFVSFCIFAPVLSRMGYGLSFQNMILCVWCGLKSPLCLTLVLEFPQDIMGTRVERTQIFLHTLGLYLFMLLINGTFVPVVLRALGLSEISMPRQINMNNCVKFIYEARTRTIAILKMDRLLSDANWPLVTNSTSMRHPYKKTLFTDDQLGNDDDEDFLGYRYTFCPDCQKHIPNEPSPKEIKEMTREAKLRILKLKKVIYSRQYEIGLLSREGVRILHQAIDIAMDSDRAVIELDVLFKLFSKEGRFFRYVQNHLQQVLQSKTETYKLYKNRYMLMCYKAITHYIYVIMMAIILLGHFVLILNYIFLINRQKNYYQICIVDGMYVAIYLTECCVKFWVYTAQYELAYLRSFWFILEASILFCTFLLFIYHTFISYKHEVSEIIYLDVITCTLIMTRILARFFSLKLLTSWPRLSNAILKYVDMKVNIHKALAYELAKNYIAGEEEILKNLTQIIDNAKIRKKIKDLIENDRHIVSWKVALAQKEKPGVASTVKTKAAIKSVLNSMKDDIYELKISGWVDDVEYNKLLNSLEERYKHISDIKFIDISAPNLIFKEVPYIGDDDLSEFLWNHISTRKYDPDGVVVEEGDIVDGIYILITGVFLVRYIPNETVINMLKEVGALPVVDSICTNQYDEPLTEYFIPGNSIGELSVLTGRTYDGRVTAETHSEAYFLSSTIVKKAIDLDPDPVNGFLCKMWKTAVFRTAVEIMMKVPVYRTFTHDKIKYLIERSFIPNLSNYKIFVVNEMIHDIILVEGVAVDFNTRDVYTAPCYIPRVVQKMILSNSSMLNMQVSIETKLMIIPAKDCNEYELMIAEEQICELVDSNSSHCLSNLIKTNALITGDSKQQQLKKGITKQIKKKLLDTSDSTKSRIKFATSTSKTETIQSEGDIEPDKKGKKN